ncbi:hypothetical protein [Actinoplanes couchii]|uniref:Uncharacterized protein n=1 Tax=Actinoplanes couchii TaxID=403638 RepID=A0ABQ3WZT4_9ACTN|nr:hypothetical protein [Actinoplanes couchii]MDR6316170.1 hypothetical protein [Actinoplanes couchii]GID51785.1 hypothetical protein Aco03nite_001890 [Actinoplanes couchii]
MNWLEFALTRVGEPCSLRLEAPGRRPIPIGPCVVARHDGGTTILCPPDTIAPPGSRVTLPDGATAEVVASLHLAAHGTRLPAHQQLDVVVATSSRPCRATGRSV